MFKKLFVALLIAGGLIGATYGAAAGINFTAPQLGAGGDSVTSCDTDVTVAYTTAFDSGSGRYEVTEVTVTAIDSTNCAGDTIKVTLTDGGVSLGEQSDAVPADNAVGPPADADPNANDSGIVLDFSSDDVSAELMDDIHVLIEG